MKSAFCQLVVISIFAFLFSLNAYAQGNKLTLDDCIELALQKRASIIAARGAEDLAKAGQRSALGAFLPRIDAGYEYSKTEVFDRTEQVGDSAEVSLPDYDSDGSSLSISAQIFSIGLSNFFDYAGAKAERTAARLDVINSEHDLIYAVKLAYYAYLANAENVAVNEEAVARSEEQLKLITSKYDLGSASRSDVLKQKVLYGNDRLALLRATNAVVTSKAALAYTIGLNPMDEVEFSRDYVAKEYDGPLDEALAFGLANEPGLMAAQKNVDASGHAVRSGYLSYLPTLGGSANYSISDDSRNETFSSSKSTSYRLGVNWSIFDGFVREGRVTSAKVRLANSRALLADTRNYMIQNIKTAYFEAERQKLAKEVAAENVDAANEDLKITREKYNLGAATILDLLNAQVSLKDAQVTLIRADFDLNLAISQLENAMGKM